MMFIFFLRGFLLITPIVALLFGCGPKKAKISKDFTLEKDRIDSQNSVIDHVLRDKTEDDNLLVPETKPDLPDVDPIREQAVSKKLVSLSVTEDIPVKDVIFEVARLAEVDVEIDPEIDAHIVLSLTDKPADEVFSRISEISGLRYTVKNNVVRFERDLPYFVNYNLSFLDLQKVGTGQFGFGDLNQNVGAMDNAIGANQHNNGVNNALNNMLGNNIGLNGNQQVNNQNGALNGAASLIGGVSANATISNTSSWSLWDSLEQGLKSIIRGDSSYTINRQAGVVTVNATQKVHKQVADYIENVKKHATAQVLIEVKLVEVNLNDEFRSGIDFTAFKNNVILPLGIDTTQLVTGAAASPLVLSGTRGPTGGVPNLNASVNLLQAFGTTKTISSPRMNVVNNQQAILSFAQNYVYFQVNPQLQNQIVTAAGVAGNFSNNIVVSSITRTVPVGVILSLQASINPDKDEVTMSVRPSLSRIVSFQSDPASAFTAAYLQNLDGANISDSLVDQLTNRIPVIEKKELDSVLKIKSGDIMVIGGFTEEQKQTTEQGVPFLKDIPVLGYLFKNKVDSTQTVETVIFIRATIIPNETALTKKDMDIYSNIAQK